MIIKTLLFLCLVTKSMSQLTLCKDNCRAGEVYSRCGAGRCEPNCWNQKVADCPCTPGCICGPGFIRDPNSYQCIPVNKCPARRPGQCPRNEVWTECRGALGCQNTCDNIGALFKCRCTPGCACVEGFIRSSINGQCIPTASCNSCPPGYSMNPKTKKCTFCCQECPENEEYNECGSFCEADCNNPTLANVICIAACKAGCFCKNGYLRDPKTLKCIPKGSCQGKQYQ